MYSCHDRSPSRPRFPACLVNQAVFLDEPGCVLPGRSLDHETIDRLLPSSGRCTCSRISLAIKVTACAPGSLQLTNVDSTPHRAHLTRATHAFFSCARGSRLKMIELCCSLVFLKSHSISSMFHRTLRDPQLAPHFSIPFPTRAPSPTTSPSLLYPSASPSTATLQGGFCFGRLAEQSPSHRL